MAKFRSKYRSGSNRIQKWDYGWNAAYFITICTKNNARYFGEIIKKQQPRPDLRRQHPTLPQQQIMKFSLIGHIANSCWTTIPDHFPFVKLGAHIIMPDHMHGIIVIDQPDLSFEHASTGHPKNKFGPQSQNLASIIRGYKAGVSINARMILPDFSWHPRFYDRIIRSQNAFDNIENYILNNPNKWKMDQLP